MKYNLTKKTILLIICASIVFVGIIGILGTQRFAFIEDRGSTIDEVSIQTYILRLSPIQTDYISNVGGFVNTVSDDSLIIDYLPPMATTTMPLVVSIASTTQLYLQEPKSAQALTSEQKEFVEQGNTSAPPLPFVSKPINSLADINEGDLVVITLSEPQEEQDTQYALKIGVIPNQ